MPYKTSSSLLALLFVAATLASTTTSSASAATPGWFLERTELTGSAALATKTPLAETFKIKSSVVAVECTGSTTTFGSGSEIKAANTLLVSSITFSECTANENCSITSKSIATLPLLAEVEEGTAPEDTAALKPKSSKTIGVVHFEGASCAVAGVQPLTGTKLTGTMPAGQEESALQALKVKAASGEIKLGSNAAELSGELSLGLGSERQFFFGLLGLKPEENVYSATAPRNGSERTTVVFRNYGLVTVTLRGEPTQGGEASWAKGANTCRDRDTLAPRATCTIEETFSATNKPSGRDYLGSIAVAATIGGGTARLKGEVP